MAAKEIIELQAVMFFPTKTIKLLYIYVAEYIIDGKNGPNSMRCPRRISSTFVNMQMALSGWPTS
jgi:hypothetical protein